MIREIYNGINSLNAESSKTYKILSRALSQVTTAFHNRQPLPESLPN